MNAPIRIPDTRLGRSVAAVAAGFASVVVLSLGVDEILHVLHVFPPWGVTMESPALFALALSYRSLFNVGGGFVTARLAPRNARKHVAVLAGIGFVAALLGVAAALAAPLGPLWYPIGLVVTAVPFTLLGGVVAARPRAFDAG